MTPRELLELRFALDTRGRMVGTNEPPPRGVAPRFTLIRTASGCAWAVRADVDDAVAARVTALAAEETPMRNVRDESRHEYASLLGGVVEGGPTFEFPGALPAARGTVTIDTIERLTRHFLGWRADEVYERQPIIAICDGDYAVSVCFCARRSATAAEAGLATAEAYRGRGYAARVTAAWAEAVRASGRAPIYSTSWANVASLAVAHKLRLVAIGNELNVLDAS
jgi:hypothetical protein